MISRYFEFDPEKIIKYRVVLFGFAILLVIFYHLFCQAGIFIFKPFLYGFIGVDIFLFLSGFGLTYSYEKSSLGLFYKRRFLRIYPLYFIKMLFFCTILFIFGRTYPISFWLAELSTYRFYQILPGQPDWYSSSLLLLYLLFPVLHYFVKSLRIKAVFLTFIFSLAVIIIYPLLISYHLFFVSRLGVFVLGIWVALLQKQTIIFDQKRIRKIVCLSFCLGLLLIILSIKLTIIRYFSTSVFCFALIVFLNNCISIFNARISYSIKKIINYLGSHSLEFFYGNCLAATLFNQLYNMPLIGKQLVYFVCTCLFSFLFIFCNRIIQNILSK